MANLENLQNNRQQIENKAGELEASGHRKVSEGRDQLMEAENLKADAQRLRNEAGSMTDTAYKYNRSDIKPAEDAADKATREVDEMLQRATVLEEQGHTNVNQGEQEIEEAASLFRSLDPRNHQ